MASAQDWAQAQTVGKPKSGNVTGLHRVEDRMAQSGASDKTQRMADKVAKEPVRVAGFLLRVVLFSKTEGNGAHFKK